MIKFLSKYLLLIIFHIDISSFMCTIGNLKTKHHCMEHINNKVQLLTPNKVQMISFGGRSPKSIFGLVYFIHIIPPLKIILSSAWQSDMISCFCTLSLFPSYLPVIDTQYIRCQNIFKKGSILRIRNKMYIQARARNALAGCPYSIMPLNP